MAQIIASTKEISNKRESLIVLSNSLKNKISLLETLGNSLNSMWEGAAKEKYVKQLKTEPKEAYPAGYASFGSSHPW